MHGVHGAVPPRAGGTLAMNPPPDGSMDEKVESAAAEWLVRHDRGLTPHEQDEFLQWLSAHPRHRESFERHRKRGSGVVGY